MKIYPYICIQGILALFFELYHINKEISHSNCHFSHSGCCTCIPYLKKKKENKISTKKKERKQDLLQEKRKKTRSPERKQKRKQEFDLDE